MLPEYYCSNIGVHLSSRYYWPFGAYARSRACVNSQLKLIDRRYRLSSVYDMQGLDVARMLCATR